MLLPEQVPHIGEKTHKKYVNEYCKKMNEFRF